MWIAVKCNGFSFASCNADFTDITLETGDPNKLARRYIINRYFIAFFRVSFGDFPRVKNAGVGVGVIKKENVDVRRVFELLITNIFTSINV